MSIADATDLESFSKGVRQESGALSNIGLISARLTRPGRYWNLQTLLSTRIQNKLREKLKLKRPTY